MSKEIKIIFGVVIIVLVIGGIWWGISKNSSERKEIKIGVILPLSGGAAAYGGQIKNGIDLAFEEISDPMIKIIYEDSKCDQKESVSAYNKLVQTDKVKIIIGDFCSSSTLSITSLAERDRILLITPGAAATKISEEGDYIFRNHVLMNQKTSLLAQAALKRFKKIAVIYNSANDTFVEGMNIFKNAYNKKDSEIVSIESFKTGDADFRTQLSKIKHNNPEAIYIGSIMPETALIVKQIKELDMNIQIFTDDSVVDSKFLNIGKNMTEGIIFGTTLFDKNISPNFWNSYNQNFNIDPTIFSAQGYDTFNIIYSVIKEQCLNGDSSCIKDSLYQIKDYSGASGKTSFNEKGDAVKEVVLRMIKDNQFVPYEE